MRQEKNSRSMASSGKMKERPPQTTSLNRKHSLDMIRSSALPPPRVTQLLHMSSSDPMAFIGLHRIFTVLSVQQYKLVLRAGQIAHVGKP